MSRPLKITPRDSGMVFPEPSRVRDLQNQTLISSVHIRQVGFGSFTISVRNCKRTRQAISFFFFLGGGVEYIYLYLHVDIYQFIMLNVKIIKATHELIKSGQKNIRVYSENGYHTLPSPHIIVFPYMFVQRKYNRLLHLVNSPVIGAC